MAGRTFEDAVEGPRAVSGQDDPTPADPPPDSGWDPEHESEVGDVRGNNCACTDQGERADRVAADNGAIRAKGGSPLHQGRAEFRFPLYESPGIVHVGEDH